MKRFCATLALIAIAQATDTEDVENAVENAEEAAETLEEGQETLDKVGDFFSSA